MENQEPATTPVLGCFFRIFWLFLGFVALIIISISIIENNLFSYRDIIYWAIIILLIVIRYVDIRFFNGQTSEGKPATMHHWRKYSLLVFIIFTLIWLAVHFIGKIF